MLRLSQVSHLRETLEESDDNEDSSKHDSAYAGAPVNDPSVLYTPNYSLAFMSTPLTSEQSNLLRDMYHERVDCLYKILHWPTFLADLALVRNCNAGWIQSRSIRALESAVCFLGLVSITEDEAIVFGLGDKALLLNQLQANTERLLAEAGLYRQPKLTSLQAFVTYLVRTFQQDHHVYAKILPASCKSLQ